MSKKIAIQGELGAYSHIAAESLYAGAEIKTCATFEETFKQAYNDQNYKIVMSTIARGISVGDELEYADEITLGRSIANRVPFDISFKS